MPLRTEIRSVQNQLKLAIQSHQMVVFKLKDQPLIPELKVQKLDIQKTIITLGEKQKKLIQQLRKELEAKSSSDGVDQLCPSYSSKSHTSPSKPHISIKPVESMKVEMPTSPDEHNITITAIKAPVSSDEPQESPTESKRVGVESKPELVTLSDSPAKIVTPSPSPTLKKRLRTPSSSPPFRQGKQSSNQVRPNGSCPVSSGSDESQDAAPFDPGLRSKLHFMTAIGLVTRQVLAELQNRRTERKRRSTANPQFVYGNTMEQAVKRKKTGYLLGGSGTTMEDLMYEPAIEERLQPPPNSMCLVCSSAKGMLNLCVSCQRAFHWSCVSEAPVPPPAVGPLHCHTCKQESSDRWTSDSNGLYQRSVAT